MSGDASLVSIGVELSSVTRDQMSSAGAPGGARRKSGGGAGRPELRALTGLRFLAAFHVLVFHALFTFRFITRSKSSSVNSGSLARCTSDPALLMRMSISASDCFSLSLNSRIPALRPPGGGSELLHRANG